MRHSLRQLVLAGLMGLLAVAFVTACSNETPPTPTELPTNTPVPTSAPIPTPVPPTATPTVAPITGPDTMPAIPGLEISPDMRLGDLVDALSESEQACISGELGDEMPASVRDAPVFTETIEQWQVSILGCLSQETASALFLAFFAAQMPPLPQEAEACLQGLLMNVDVAALVASLTPDAGPAAEAAALQFGFGLLTCLPPEMMEGLLGGDGPGSPTEPAPTDDTSLWSFATGGWVVNAPD